MSKRIAMIGAGSIIFCKTLMATSCPRRRWRIAMTRAGNGARLRLKREVRWLRLRLLEGKLAEIMPQASPTPSALHTAFDRLNTQIDACCQEQRLAA
jgi:hypothetical protein